MQCDFVHLYCFGGERYLESMQTIAIQNGVPLGSDTRMPHGSVLTLRGARGRRIVCQAGRLWLTEEGIKADFVLAAGQSYTVRGAGKVVVEVVVGEGRVLIS